MKNIGPKILIWSAAMAALPNCGNVSELLERKRSSQSKSVYVQDITIQYDNLAPANFGDPWTRRVVILNKKRPVPNVLINVRRYGETAFRPLGLTDASGSIDDTTVNQHSQYQIGESLLSEWQTARHDLVWTQDTSFDFLKKNYFALNTNKVIETNLSKEPNLPFTLQADRIFVERGVIASWNRKSPLIIVASSLQIDGTLRAFSPDCADGSHAPTLEINSNFVAGAGTIEWSGCRGTPGAQGARGKKGKDDKNGMSSGGKGGTGAVGGNGGTGGNGGNIFLRTKILEMSYQQIIADAGLGGQAGPGGPGGYGGKGGADYSRGMGRDDEIRFRGFTENGKAGKSGPMGDQGPAGTAGEVHLTVDNKIFNVSSN